MASNSFGQVFRITTWGESHGPAIGVVIDGCPAGVEITEEEIYLDLQKRSPGFHALTSPRRESDKPHILSGVFEGKTTGTPISIIIYNQDVDSSKYEPIKDLLRPGHAQSSYQNKYQIYDYRGGGRASARETACRVAAAAIAKKILNQQGLRVHCFLKQVGVLKATFPKNFNHLRQSTISCPDKQFESQVHEYLKDIQAQGDSVGGSVAFYIEGVPCGLGDPIYQKLEACLALAMMSIPASKAFSIGEGFDAAVMHGSQHNDEYVNLKETKTNHAGGILAGISTGMPIWGELAFKPTSSIMKTQATVDKHGQPQEFSLPAGSRHDPCVAIRAVPVVEAMCYLTLIDAWLMNRFSII
jgi:chorismate synthase